MHAPVPYVGVGNTKVGTVATFSLPSGIACPEATPWCRDHCYAARIEQLRPQCRALYAHNLAATWNTQGFIHGMLDLLPPRLPAMRLHVGGDFYSRPYIEAWQVICRQRPHTRFWAYTRAWLNPQLRAVLDTLRSLPHVQLFASVDPDMPLPPSDWRMAYVDTDPRQHGLLCPQQASKPATCVACGYCFGPHQGDVIFMVH